MMDSSVESGFHSLPAGGEMLMEIFSHLTHNERLKMALVCKDWFKASRSARFHLPVKKISVPSKEYDEFINVFGGGSKFLPVKCIQVEMKLRREFFADDKRQLDDLMKQLGSVYIEVHLKIDFRYQEFDNFIKSLPKIVKKFYWNLELSEENVSNFETQWLNICDAIYKKDFEVVISCKRSIYSPTLNILLSLLSKEEFKKIIFEEAYLNLEELSTLDMDHQKLFVLFKDLKALTCSASTPMHFQFIKNFMEQNLSLHKLRLYSRGPFDTENFTEFIPDSNQLQEIELLFNTFQFDTIYLTQTLCNLRYLKKFEIDVRFWSIDLNSFEKFLISCPNVEEIVINIMYWRSEEDSRLFSKISEFCNALKKLCFWNRNEYNQCRFDSFLLILVTNGLLHKLELLRTNVSCSDLIIFKDLQLNVLKTLGVRSDRITVEGAKTLVEACPNLEKLSLFGKNPESNLINGKCIQILSRLKKLTFIALNGCDDEAIEILKQPNPTLEVKLF